MLLRTALAALLAASLLAAPALAATPRTGSWRGETSQGLPISFKVARDGGQVRAFRVRVRFGCEEGPLTATRKVTRFAVKSGRFRLKARNAAGDSLSLRGRFPRRGRARGTLRIKEDSLRDGLCNSGLVRWTARRRR